MDRLALHAARFDQGMLGHEAVKPTQTVTTSGSLWEFLNGRLVPLAELWHVDRGPTMRDRVRASQSHAAWAPGLVEALRLALTRWKVEAVEDDSEPKRLAKFGIVHLSRVDKHQEWKRHCAQGHLPWRKDCLACLESAAYMRPHRRQRHPILLNMMADLAGPYQEGEDVEVQRGRYILMVVYPFPLWITDSVPDDAPIPGDAHFLDEDEGVPEDVPLPDSFDTIIEDEIRVDPSKKERDLADKETAAWDSVVETLKGTYKVVNLCFSEILPNKRPATVASGLSRVYARLRSYGFPVYGLYTDRGGEMVNSAVRIWCEARSLLRRTSVPESHASNGRVERLLALVRRESRALLASAGLKPHMWPHAVRHATEQRCRQALATLSHPVKPMIPFWSRVSIRARTWNDKKWSSRALTGHVAAPSADVDGGWVVRVQGEKVQFYVSTLLYLNVHASLKPPDLTTDATEDYRPPPYPEPVHRHRSKSPVTLGDEGAVPANPDLKVPRDTLVGLPPVRRHLDKGTSGLPSGASSSVGSSPVPGSFVESLAGRASSSAFPVAAAAPVDKTRIVEDGPCMRRVVGRNPDFQEFTPAPGYYRPLRRVRYCRLQPEQWRVIRSMRPNQVPGLGDRWIDLPLEQPQHLLAEHPTELIPGALYFERDRDWLQFPVVTARSSSGVLVDIARVTFVEHAMTSNGGQYSVFEFEDLTMQREAVLLLWIQVQIHRVYEPLPVPRVAALSCCAVFRQSLSPWPGGGIFCVFSRTG